MAHVDFMPRQLYNTTMVDRFNVVPGLKTSTVFFTFLRANLVVTPSAMSTPDLEPASVRALPPPPSPSQSPLVTVERTVADAPLEVAGGRPGSSPRSSAQPRPRSAPRAPPPADDLPPLTVGVLHSDAEKAEALELIADSIAQQRQSAAMHMIFHPYLLAALTAALAICHQVVASRRQPPLPPPPPPPRPLRRGSCPARLGGDEGAGAGAGSLLGLDFGTALMLYCCVLMTYLLAIRYFAGRYIRVAEALRWSWLVPPGDDDDGDGNDNNSSSSSSNGGRGRGKPAGKEKREEDTVIGVRFGNQLIGALVLRLEAKPGVNGGGGGGGKRRARQQQQQLRRGGGHGVIRAWTVARRYRGRGVGMDLLREAVRAARERCGRDADVGFAREHANGAPVLPEAFNGPLRRGERRAAAALDRVLAEWDSSRRHRRRKS